MKDSNVFLEPDDLAQTVRHLVDDVGLVCGAARDHAPILLPGDGAVQIMECAKRQRPPSASNSRCCYDKDWRHLPIRERRA